MVLPEVEEDTNQGWAQNWTRKEILVETATLVTEGAIEDETDLTDFLLERRDT